MTISNGRRLAIPAAAILWLSLLGFKGALAAPAPAPETGLPLRAGPAMANGGNFPLPATFHLPLDPRLAACLPGRLHPVSRMFLEAWLAGDIGTPTFRRFFHMPNSDYLEVSKCLVAARKAISPPIPASGEA